MASQPNIVEARGADGILYAIRSMEWDLTKIEKAWARWEPLGVIPDDFPHNVDGFYTFVTGTGALWFEVINDRTDEQVGLIFINELAFSITRNRYTQALFHAIMWDGKAGVRRELGKRFLIWLFDRFGFHRLQAEIPLKFGGAIRTLQRMGFKMEGTLREARQFDGEWYNVLVLGLLDHEVRNERPVQTGAGRSLQHR